MSFGRDIRERIRSVFINIINSKFFKRGKEEYAFLVDKNTHDGNIRLCT